MKRTETSITNIMGEQFGPYKLVSRLGVGGMAETFVAIRSGPGDFTQRVCLKLVLPFFREDEDFVRLFEREARLAATLRHRNIVGVIDFGQIEGTAYMALELVDGVDLRKLLDAQKGKRLAPEFVALLGLELAAALEHAHTPLEQSGLHIDISDAPGIVHRDISPSNVLVSRRGEVFLTDFGVAKAMSGGSRKQSAVKGKVPYMAPEYLRAEEMDGRSDLFSLGVVLFEALAGERPYEGAHDPATILQILKGEHTPLATLVPEAPEGLCRLIDTLIEQDLEDRPPNAGVLIEELAEFAESVTSHRRLGRIVSKLHDSTEQLERQPTERPAPGRTEVLPDSPKETTGVNRTTEPPPAEEAPTEQSKRSDSAEESLVPSAPWQAQAAGEIEQPIALVRPPKRRGLQAGDLSSLLMTPLGGSPFGGKKQQEGASPGRKRLVLSLATLLGIGGLAGVTIALWPDAESPGEGAPSSETSEPPDAKPDPSSSTDPPGQGTGAPPPAEPAKIEGAEPPAPVAPASVTQEPEPDEVAVPPTPPEPTRRPATTPGEPETRETRTRPARTTERQPRAPAPQRAQPKAGRLTISVIPFGDIWINGAPWGPAPLKSESLPPGTYVIGAGKGKPERTRTVQLKAGERRFVEFDLTR